MITILYIILHAGENSSPPKVTLSAQTPVTEGLSLVAEPKSGPMVLMNTVGGSGPYTLRTDRLSLVAEPFVFSMFSHLIFIMPFLFLLFLSSCFFFFVKLSFPSPLRALRAWP